MSNIIQHRNKKDALETIRDFLLDKRGRVILSDKEQEIYVRLRAAWTLLMNFHSREQAINVMMKDWNVSEQGAKNYVLDALWLYGDTNRPDKEGMRLVASEMAMKTYQVAAEAGDHNAMNQAMKNFVKVNGLDKDDPDKVDFAKLQGSIFVNVLDENSKKQLNALTNKPGTIDLTKIEYSNYEEVANRGGADQGADSDIE